MTVVVLKRIALQSRRMGVQEKKRNVKVQTLPRSSHWSLRKHFAPPPSSHADTRNIKRMTQTAILTQTKVLEVIGWIALRNCLDEEA